MEEESTVSHSIGHTRKMPAVQLLYTDNVCLHVPMTVHIV